ncbi:MAG TPA: hypothetical protein PLE16_13275 [Spirochaetota bacterium]|nr:hypothetical protein [Spirochaetota bacterium]
MNKLIHLTSLLLTLTLAINFASCKTKRNRNPNIKPIQFRLVKTGAENIFTQKDHSVDYLEETVLMSEKDISGIFAQKDAIGRPTMRIILTDEASKTFYDITKNNMGRIIAVVHDGRVIFSPKIMAQITDGDFEVSGEFSHNQMEELVNVLNGIK